MLFVELALQGVKGFPSVVRMGLKPGLNVVQLPDPNMRASLVDAMYHAIFPDPSRGSATAHLVGTEPTRIALTFYGRDKITYRVVREAANGATKLYKFDPAQNQYQLFTNVAQEVAQYIRVQQRIPDEVGYERLFLFSRETLPSKGVKARSRSGVAIVPADRAPSGPGMPAADRPMFGAPPRMMSGISQPPPRSTSGFGSPMNMTNALVLSELEGSLDLHLDENDSAPTPQTIAEKQKQLIELRKEHAAALRGEQAQAEIDQLNARKFELTEKVERLKKVEAERQRLVELYEKEADLRSLPLGFAQRLERFEEVQRKHEAERGRASEELTALLDESNNLHILPLSKDPYVVAGILGAILSFTFAVTMSMPAIAWLNVLAMIIGAGGAFRYVGDLEHQHKLGMRIRSARDRMDRIERQYNEDVRATRDLMLKLEVDSPQTLLERIRGHEKLQHQIRVADEAIKKLTADPEIASARREIEQIALRIEVLESEVLGASSSVSAETLARRIRALEAELGSHAPPPEVVRAPPPRRTSSAFFPPPAALPRAESFLSGDIPPVPPFTESSQTAPADPRRLSVKPHPAIGAHHKTWDEDSDPSDGGYGGRGPSRSSGGGSSFSAGGGLFAIGFGGPPGALGGGGLGGYGGYGGYGDDSGGSLPPDRSRDLFGVAKDLLSIEVDELAQRIRPRLGQYLTAFTDKTHRDATFGPRGELSVVGPEGDSIPYVQLSPEVMDMVDSALRFTLMEACLREVRVPVIFDDPFTRFAPKKRKLLNQMLGYLGSATQVIVLTDQSDISGNPVSL